MIKKTLGYVISAIGLIILAVGTMPPLRTAVKIIPEEINDITIMAIGLIITVVGIFFIYRTSSGGKQPAEVPIYEGKNVVGFRRVGKK